MKRWLRRRLPDGRRAVDVQRVMLLQACCRAGCWRGSQDAVDLSVLRVEIFADAAGQWLSMAMGSLRRCSSA